MPRVDNWPLRLAEVIEAASAKTFAWGSHDCCQFAASAVAAITSRDPRELFQLYGSEREALVVIARCGGMEQLIRQALGEPKHPAFAQRGDIVLCDFGQGPQPGVCIGVWSVAPGAQGLEKRMTDSALLAWSV